jgi:hypothetical protein
MMLHNGDSGTGFGIPAGVKPHRPVPLAATGRTLGRSDLALLDRPVTNQQPNGLALMYRIAPGAVLTLADAVGVPLGFESLPASAPLVRAPVTGIRLSGTFGPALDDLVTFDPRYEWRDVDGIVVIRPTTAWLDPDNPLFRTVSAIRLEDVTLAKALGALRQALGGPGVPLSLSDTRRFSVDVPQGRTVLDVLTAISRAHGDFA